MISLHCRRQRQDGSIAVLTADDLQSDGQTGRRRGRTGTDATGRPVRLNTKVGAIQSM